MFIELSIILEWPYLVRGKRKIVDMSILYHRLLFSHHVNMTGSMED